MYFTFSIQAYIYSQAEHIIGIEVNSYFSELQARVISKYGLSSRVKVVNNDVRHQAELLQHADVIVMNNVFEFFCSLEEQARWIKFICGWLMLIIASTKSVWEREYIVLHVCDSYWNSYDNAGGIIDVPESVIL